MFFAKIRKIILDILFPIECLGCGKSDVWLCNECFQKLPLNKNYFEPLDFLPSYLDGFFIASDWENKILQDVIHKFKYNFVQELSEPLSDLLIKKMELIFEIYDELRNFILIPVPLHKRRLLWRGFNQAEILAQPVAEKFQMELDNNLLKRVKNTSPQVKLKSEQRAKNIQGAFGLNCRKVAMPRSYLLIDDVITTGATMNEIAKVLKENGAKRVWALALARG